MDEGIAVCRALWGPSPASFEGRFTRFTDVVLEPKPVQPGGPPIWIGGRSDAALRRAARVGDGWIAYLVTPERFRASVEKIEGFAREIGRPLDPAGRFETAHVLFTVVDDDPESARATAARYLEHQYHQPFDDLARKYCLLGPAGGVPRAARPGSWPPACGRSSSTSRCRPSASWSSSSASGPRSCPTCRTGPDRTRAASGSWRT